MNETIRPVSLFNLLKAFKSMKNQKPLLLLLLCISLSFSGCRKDNTLHQVFFFTNLSGEKGQLDLYVNDTYQGKLPYINASAMELHDSLLSKTLSIGLKSGAYTIKARNSVDELKVNCRISFSTNKTSTSGSMGGNELSGRNKQLVVNLFY